MYACRESCREAGCSGEWLTKTSVRYKPYRGTESPSLSVYLNLCTKIPNSDLVGLDITDISTSSIGLEGMKSVRVPSLRSKEI